MCSGGMMGRRNGDRGEVEGMAMSKFDFDRHWAESPEPKLELLAGRLTIGNSLNGSRWTLHDLLHGYGAAGALPFAEDANWMESLRLGFHDLDPPAVDKPLPAWQ